MADLMNNMNQDVLKVPLGFIRIVEFPFVLIAFAAACNLKWTGSVTLDDYKPEGCTANATTNVYIWYPFALNSASNNLDSECSAVNERNIFSQGFQSNAQFYVFTGVISFLYILGILFIYLFKWPLYENDKRLPMVDLVVTAVLTVFWICGTLAWSVAVSSIRGHDTETMTDSLRATLKCSTCKVDASPSYGGIIISAIAGYGCIVAFVGNVWFVYKETEFFRSRQAPPPVGNIPGNTDAGDYPPPAASGAGEWINEPRPAADLQPKASSTSDGKIL